MAPYKQRCICVGRRLSARHDFQRYDDRARELKRDAELTRSDLYGLETRISAADGRERTLLVLERDTMAGDLRQLLLEAHRIGKRADRAFELITNGDTTAPCVLCGDTGHLVGNGSALIGGSGKGGRTEE